MCKTKVCSHCHRELPVELFAKCAKSPDGLQYSCKACQSESAKKSIKAKRERIRLAQQAVDKAPMSAKSVVTADGRVLNSISGKMLHEYDARELLEELKRRGYIWGDMYLKQQIRYDAI